MSLQSALAALGGDAPASTPAPNPETAAPAAPAAPAQPDSAALTGAPNTEAPPAAKPESASAAFQLIAKEKKRILELKQQAQSRDKELTDREAKVRDQEGRFAKKPATPMESLMRDGWTYEDATNFILNNQQLTPDQQIKSVRDEIAAFKKEQEEAKALEAQTTKERAEQAHAQAVEGFKSQIGDAVTGNPEKYELSNLEDPDDIKNLGYQLADLHFNQHKKVLSVEEVADLVEGYLEERATKLIAAKKVQAKWKPADPAALPAKDAPAPGEAKPPTTLAAAITSAPAPVHNPARSEADRLRRAHEALERLGK